jgi:ATP-dependent RNA helicase RhlE
MTFAALGLSKALLTALEAQNYTTPTPIQQQAIPVILQGRDVMAAAQTGTGKTAGFTLPLLHRLMLNPREAGAKGVRALILTPTRELAAQVMENVQDYSQHLPLKHAVVFGGVGIQPQINVLRKGIDILVATPGRLLDLHEQKAVHFNHVEYLVLDEADRMLDMGFIHDIRKIIKLLPQKRQTLLFSATFSDEIQALAKGLLYKPELIEVAKRNTTAATITQSVFEVEKAKKTALMSHLIRANDWQQVLIFTRTKHGANRLAEKLLKDGISSAAIHGNKSQNARTKALADFKQGNIRALVATDIAARGLDIEQLPQVVNFEMPNVAEDYVHRIGRTGRAGMEGKAISLVDREELDSLKAIEKLIRQTLVREAVPAITTSTLAPIVRPESQPSKPAKANKPKAAKPSNSTPASKANKPKPTGKPANKPSAAQTPNTKLSTSAPKPSRPRGEGVKSTPNVVTKVRSKPQPKRVAAS